MFGNDGVYAKILTKFGNKIKTSINIYEKCNQKYFTWRKNLECAIPFIDTDTITIDTSNKTLSINISVNINGNENLMFEFLSIEDVDLVANTLKQLKVASNSNTTNQDSFTILNDKITTELMLKSEDTYCRLTSQKYMEGIQRLDIILSQKRSDTLQSFFGKWADHVQKNNTKHVQEDRSRWRHHALANQGLDLQAWYHAIYYKEVYRPRGLFWYRDAVLPTYRSSYDLVEHSLSALEEAALAHVLCSPETSYGDVAGQMFVVQAVVNRPPLFTLFQKLTAEGMTIAKVPSSGQISKKLFRFSFVEGSIYFTWSGKNGNQGVDLLEVSDVTIGRVTDTLKKNGSDKYEHLYLSVFSKGKSIDLCFTTTEIRNDFKDLFDTLINKELNQLSQVPPLLDIDDESVAENEYNNDTNLISDEGGNLERKWLAWYSSIGECVLPPSVKESIAIRSKLPSTAPSLSISTTKVVTVEEKDVV